MKKLLLLILLLCLVAPKCVHAYPPDNAALIYYKYMVNFAPPEDPIGDQISDAAMGRIEVNEDIQNYLESKEQLIRALETASAIEKCDWAIDFSEGLSTEMSHLAKMRQFSYILVADARLKSQEGQFAESLDQCLCGLRMAGHVGNDTLISYLVGTSISTLSYDAIGDVLAVIGPDEKLLTEVQRELELPEYNRLDLKPPMVNERRCIADTLVQMTPEKKKLLEEQVAPSEELKKDITLLTEGSEDFLAASADYYQRFFDKYIAALEQPYKQGLQTLETLKDVPQKDYESGKKDAYATVLLAPAVERIYDIDIRRRTHQNALTAAIQLYRYYAKNQTLPEKLPASFGKDLFSGQPFEYEKTAGNFTLRCRQADTKGKIYEYTFKLP